MYMNNASVHRRVSIKSLDFASANGFASDFTQSTSSYTGILFIRFFLILMLFLFSFSSYASQPLSSSKDKMVFLALADIHFDPFIYCRSSSCPLFNKLQSSPVTQWDKIFQWQKNWILAYGKDSDYYLLQKTVQQIKTINQKYPLRFVVILGDFIGHDYKKHYRYYNKSTAGYAGFVQKTYVYLAQKLKEHLPDTSLFFVIGNNDSYEKNYKLSYHAAFFPDVGQMFSKLIVDNNESGSMRQQFARNGYYAIPLEKYALRLLFLNTTFFSYKAQGKQVKTAAFEELSWLHQQLALAKSHQQKVILFLHIPPQFDVTLTSHWRLFTLIHFWHKQYIDIFNRDLAQFSDTISAILSAHIHRSSQQVLRINKNEILWQGVPSISPNLGNKPAMELYEYLPFSHSVQKIETYTFPLQTRVWLNS